MFQASCSSGARTAWSDYEAAGTFPISSQLRPSHTLTKNLNTLTTSSTTNSLDEALAIYSTMTVIHHSISSRSFTVLTQTSAKLNSTPVRADSQSTDCAPGSSNVIITVSSLPKQAKKRSQSRRSGRIHREAPTHLAHLSSPDKVERRHATYLPYSPLDGKELQEALPNIDKPMLRRNATYVKSDPSPSPAVAPQFDQLTLDDDNASSPTPRRMGLVLHPVDLADLQSLVPP